jgi:hypothetical protein
MVLFVEVVICQMIAFTTKDHFVDYKCVFESTTLVIKKNAPLMDIYGHFVSSLSFDPTTMADSQSLR